MTKKNRKLWKTKPKNIITRKEETQNYRKRNNIINTK
jgi:hypothetical protein